MFKLKGKLHLDIKKLTQGYRRSLNAVAGKTASDLKNHMHSLAKEEMPQGVKHWEKNFKLDKINSNTYVISISGKLATMMEDGFTGDQLKSMLLSGNRAKHNKANGKPYIDVPKTIQSAEGAVDVRKLNIQFTQLKSADDLIKNLGKKDVKISDWANKNVKLEQRTIQRINDTILSRQKGVKGPMKSSIMQINRISEKSNIKNWKGGKIFEKNLDAFLNKQFELNLKRLL